MPEFKVFLTDQGHHFTRTVRAIDKHAAMKSAVALSYATAIDAEEIIPEVVNTYLEEIQAMRRHLQNANAKAGMLRDCANAKEKDYFNSIRGTVQYLMANVESLETLVIDSNRADMKI